MDNTFLYRISVVIPVYRGESTLPTIVAELSKLAIERVTPAGRRAIVNEVLLAHDCGPDRSDKTLEALSAEFAFVTPVWLTRNYGQHAATMAGMASATSEWVVTLDEDGQQNPEDILLMLDAAIDGDLQLVYAQPINPPPHGWLRNLLSHTAKTVSNRLLGNKSLGKFNSFRMIDGEIARTLAAYCGNGVYLDVGLFWITGRIGHCKIKLRNELDRPSGYSYLKLIAHFWSLVLTTGTRPLRLITIVGFGSMLLAMVIAAAALYGKYAGDIPIQGWASLVVVVSFFSGTILAALGVISEYMAVTMGIAMGKPLYVVSSKPVRPARR